MSEVVMKKGASSFNLIGRAKITQYTFDLDKTSTSGFNYHRLNLGVDCGNGNIVYGEMMGGFNPSKDVYLYVHGKDEDGKDEWSNRFEVAWEDRDNPTILESVGENCFIKVAIENDADGKLVTEKFLSAYDAIAYLSSNLQDNTVVSIRGDLEYSVYNKEIQMRKKITHIYASKKEENEFEAKFTQVVLINQDSLSKKMNDNKCLEIFALVPEYINKLEGVDVKQNVLLERMFEFDPMTLKEESRQGFLKKFFTAKKGWYSEIVMEGMIQEGATVVATSIDDLDTQLQEMISYGLMSVEEAINKSAVTGTRSKRMIFTRPFVTTKLKDDVSVSTIHHNPERYKEDEVVLLSHVSSKDEEVEDEAPFEVATDTVVESSDVIDLDAMFAGM